MEWGSGRPGCKSRHLVYKLIQPSVSGVGFVVAKQTFFRLLPLVLAFSIVTCGDPAAVIGPPGLTIIAGAGVTDTIEAQPTQALIVEVRTPSGAPARGAVVHFASGPID